MYNFTRDIRSEFIGQYKANNIINGTVEITGVSFVADQPTIFGKGNVKYINAEIEWYESQSLFVGDLFNLYGQEVSIWKECADWYGKINSNYGWMIYSTENEDQYNNVYNELNTNPTSRRAVMVYTRPNIHYQSNRRGMQDFICTNAVQYLIRENELDVIVQMRSNDAVFGYINDLAWQKHVQMKLCDDLHIKPGKIHWQVGSMHVYERHYHLIEEHL